MAKYYRLDWRQRLRLAWWILSRGEDRRYDECLDALMHASQEAPRG